MAIFLRKYFWTLNLATIALCALLAAHGVSQAVMAAVPVPSRARPPALPMTDGRPRPPNISRVVERNIFCSTCEPVEATQRVSSGGGERRDTTLDLRLIATLVSPVADRQSYAAIRDPASQRTGLFGIGSLLPVAGEAVITEIEDRRVMFRRDGQTEVLALAQDQSPTPPRPAPPQISGRNAPRPGGPLAWLARGIRKVGSTRWEIDRGALNKVLANTTMIGRSARIVPSLRNGKPSGFKLIGIRPGSFYSLLGMFNGDTINAINGRPITTPDRALQIYTSLRSASHVSISFTRRGAPLTHEYTIR